MRDWEHSSSTWNKDMVRKNSVLFPVHMTYGGGSNVLHYPQQRGRVEGEWEGERIVWIVWRRVGVRGEKRKWCETGRWNVCRREAGAGMHVMEYQERRLSGRWKCSGLFFEGSNGRTRVRMGDSSLKAKSPDSHRRFML